jgi:hypothetical protein
MVRAGSQIFDDSRKETLGKSEKVGKEVVGLW